MWNSNGSINAFPVENKQQQRFFPAELKQQYQESSCENQAETLRLFPLFRIEFREPSFALYGLLFAVEKMCETDEVSAPLLTGAAYPRRGRTATHIDSTALRAYRSMDRNRSLKHAPAFLRCFGVCIVHMHAFVACNCTCCRRRINVRRGLVGNIAFVRAIDIFPVLACLALGR